MQCERLDPAGRLANCDVALRQLRQRSQFLRDERTPERLQGVAPLLILDQTGHESAVAGSGVARQRHRPDAGCCIAAFAAVSALLANAKSGSAGVLVAAAAHVRNRHCERRLSPPCDGWSALVSGSPTADECTAACVLAEPSTAG
jgi:hypothetical protein